MTDLQQRDAGVAVADAVRERPILFSGPMVRAILDGHKTMTRRVIVPQPYGETTAAELSALLTCRLGQPGDRLWVRETWADTNGENGPMISYRAGGDRFLVDESYPVDYSRYPDCNFAMWGGDLRRGAPDHSWRQSIFMPRWASRLSLEITEVRVERLQEITGDGVIAEGVEFPVATDCTPDALAARWAPFQQLWDGLNESRGYGWSANPWVWVISFRRPSPT